VQPVERAGGAEGRDKVRYGDCRSHVPHNPPAGRVDRIEGALTVIATAPLLSSRPERSRVPSGCGEISAQVGIGRDGDLCDPGCPLGVYPAVEMTVCCLSLRISYGWASC